MADTRDGAPEQASTDDKRQRVPNPALADLPWAANPYELNQYRLSTQENARLAAAVANLLRQHHRLRRDRLAEFYDVVRPWVLDYAAQAIGIPTTRLLDLLRHHASNDAGGQAKAHYAALMSEWQDDTPDDAYARAEAVLGQFINGCSLRMMPGENPDYGQPSM